MDTVHAKKKPTKWDMKTWVLADSSNGYVYNWKLYTGKDGDHTEKGLAHSVVLDLVQDLQGKGYHLYVDNFYTSPALFTDLIRQGFAVCGVPETFKSYRLTKGERFSQLSDDGTLMYLKWKDKREVSMLSSFHDDSNITRRRRTKRSANGTETIKKPRMIEEYNQYMGGVDQSDQILLYYGFAHRSTKWWKWAFYHLVDLTLVNAQI